MNFLFQRYDRRLESTAISLGLVKIVMLSDSQIELQELSTDKRHRVKETTQVMQITSAALKSWKRELACTRQPEIMPRRIGEHWPTSRD